MYIKSVYYDDFDSNWQLEPLELDNPLTLLIGGNGVGKSRILQAIRNIVNIANGHIISGVQWDISFNIDNTHSYQWQGKFGSEDMPEIVFEKLYLNNEEILNRKYNSSISALRILYDDVAISRIRDEFNKIYFGNDKLQLDISLYENEELFETIKSYFLNTFQFIEDLKVEMYKEDGIFENTSYSMVSFKEKGMNYWIPLEKMSTGMITYLQFLISVYLQNDNSVILIDDFGNGLDINCISDMVNHLMNHNKKLQFIITSNQPYVINNIPFKYWKLVTRKGYNVITHNVNELNLGKSKHDAYIQLINLDEYNNPIEIIS